MTDPGDQTAVVGHTLTVHLYASDPDGDNLEFGFEAAGLPDKDSTTSLTIAPDGHGVFTFTPVASQEGTHLFDFTVSDGRNKDVASVVIEVRGTLASASMPVFRKPLGSGTVLDLQQTECADLDITIDDPDSASVALAVVPPLIEGATLNVASNGLSGTWTWCPEQTQLRERQRFDLSMEADDGDNPATRKDYVIVVRRGNGADCPGEAPVISHTPEDVATGLDVEITAEITEDKGLGAAPLLLYSFENPGDPVDFSKLTVLEMQLSGGDPASTSTWKAFIPNPVATAEEGASSSIYYLISADDNDDEDGDCDHRSDSPTRGVHKMSVTNNGQYDASACYPCSWDIQCGAEADLCIVGGGSQSYCGKACESNSQCDEGYVCSTAAVQSVEGTTARQCVPNSGTCGGTAGQCTDDAAEDDDSHAQAKDLGPLEDTATYEAMLCQNDDDWYYIQLTNKTKISIILYGDDKQFNTDVTLVDVAGNTLKSSTGLGADESFMSSCLAPGDYYVRVYDGFASGSFGAYSLMYASDSTGCGGVQGTGTCCAIHDTPGCEDAAVQACACEKDDYCCDPAGKWDSICVGHATQCGACSAASDACCEDHGGQGCNDPVIEACVCEVDSACCSTSWDAYCVDGGSAPIKCVTSCSPEDEDGSCCSPNGTPGCNDNDVEMCVCEDDPFCCSTKWDEWCVQKVDTLGCGICPGS